jgi:beta-N-acetylhexosaminidase
MMPIIERKVARLFCIGFDGLSPTSELKDLLARGVGGVILFKRNIASSAQLRDLCAEIKSLAPVPVAIDHEGGRVQRLSSEFTDIPPAREVGTRNDERFAREIGRIIGRELCEVGIDIDFAPVMDVDTNPANPVIGARSFGPDPQLVARMGTQVLLGIQEQHVAACAKHFPGHGDTNIDSHLDLPSLEHDVTRLEKIELPPFKAAIEAGVAMVMTSHIVFRRLDAGLPATMSRRMVTELLREKLRFDGVVVSDDLEMKAITSHFGVDRAAVACVNAGVDWMLICHTPSVQQRSIDVLVRAVEEGEIPMARIDESNRRIDQLLELYGAARA